MGEGVSGKSVQAAKRVARPRVKPAVSSVPTEAAAVALAPVVAQVMAAPIEISTPAPAPRAEHPATESVAPIDAPAPIEAAPPAAVPADSPKEDTMATVINEAADKAKDTTAFTADAAKSMTAEAQDRASEAMQKGMKFVEEMNAFAKGNVEAMVEASKIAAKGAEDMAKYSTDYARGSVEKANERARRMAAVKSPTELLQLQSELARETMDSVAQETSKFAEGYLKLLGEIAQPFQNRFAVAAEKMKAA